MKILYFLFTCLASGIARLPFRLLYCLSDFLGWSLFHLIRYRRSVVYTNLKNAFPEKTDKERRKIARSYYRNLGDIILEVIKTQGMSQEDFAEKISFKNFEVANQFLSRGRSIILATGHLGNWEWLGVRLSTSVGFRPFAVVKPLSDKFFNDYVSSLRLQFAKEGMIDFRKTFREMIKLKNDTCLTMIAGDQTPTKDEISYWTRFLNQDTAVFLGIEKLARFLDQPVIFLDMQRKTRGYYEVVLTLLTDNPKYTEDNQITESHVHMLEEVIRERPDNWLWSHRRWKHKKNYA